MDACIIPQICICILAFPWNHTNLIRNFLNVFCKIMIFLPTLGVYELVTFQMKPGGPALWGDAFKRAILAHVNLGYSKLVGVFHTEYGALNRGIVAHFFYETAKDIGELLSSLGQFGLFIMACILIFYCQIFRGFCNFKGEKTCFTLTI